MFQEFGIVGHIRINKQIISKQKNKKELGITTIHGEKK